MRYLLFYGHVSNYGNKYHIALTDDNYGFIEYLKTPFTTADPNYGQSYFDSKEQAKEHLKEWFASHPEEFADYVATRLKDTA